jgi:uncharacterized membrane protein YedE/YeeE
VSQFLAARAPFFVSGPIIGLMVVVLLWTANQHFGSTGGFIAVSDFIRRPSAGLSWRGWMFIGVFLGGVVYAVASGTYAPGFSHGRLDQALSLPARAFVLAGAGVAIGWGVRTARGCTSGHGICGTALGSPMSMAATATFMAAAIATSHLLVAAGVLP